MNDNREETFEYLGKEFQFRLIKKILWDKKFANNILDSLEPNYFEDEYLRRIVGIIKDIHEENNEIPDVESIKIRINEQVREEFKRKLYVENIDRIINASLNDDEFIEREALDFCRRQELKRARAEVDDIIFKGESDKFDQIIDIYQKALEMGESKDEPSDVFENIDDVLSDDYRDPISTGISKLDEIMNGGLDKTEMGLVLAPLGVGKTSILTKFANAAKEEGYNVLHIFFEDQKGDIQRKHLSAWTNLDLNAFKEYKNYLKDVIEEKKTSGGVLKLKKFNSAGVTIPKIKQYIRKQMTQGFVPDMVVLDYIDCVNPSKYFKSDDIHQSEGNVIRDFEAMLDELNLAGWTAAQGNRSSINAEIVEADQTGGSIRKAQVGHFIMSIAKALEQKEEGLANLAILKSRLGDDGLTFNDIIFENSKMRIQIPEDAERRTFLEEKKESRKKQQEKINNLFDQKKNGETKSVESNNNNENDQK